MEPSSNREASFVASLIEEVVMIAHRAILFSAALIGLSLANPPDAKADLCFRYGSGGGTLVAKGATIPREGTCQSLALYEVQPGGRAGAANGLVCRDGPGSGGVTIIFHYNYDACIGPGSYTESATCRLQLNNAGNLPTVGSSCRGTANGSPFFDLTLRLDNCAGVDTTVPGGGGGQCFAGSGFSHQKLDEEQSPGVQGVR
jgi:hypothetical protein